MSHSVVAPQSCTAFVGHARIATGSLSEVALATKRIVDQGELSPILIFDNATSLPVEIDFRGTPEEVSARLAVRFSDSRSAGTAESVESADSPRRAGRPKLGVVGREVTLLPRHWDWLAAQPGGASVVIRRLIDKERKASEFKDLDRKNQETVYRFIHAVGGNLAGFEEVSRALFAGNREAFARLTEAWPIDVREHARWLMVGGPNATEDAQSP